MTYREFDERAALADELRRLRESGTTDVGEAERALLRQLRDLERVALPVLSAKVLDGQIVASSSCGEPWSAMVGDACARECSKCGREVFNAALMNESDRAKSGLDGRVFRNEDGTLSATDCPIGVQEKRRRRSRIALFATLGTLLVFSIAFAFAALRAGRVAPSVTRLRTLDAPIADECTVCRENSRWSQPWQPGMPLIDDCTTCNSLVPAPVRAPTSEDIFPTASPESAVSVRPLRLVSPLNQIEVVGPLSRARAEQVVQSHADQIEACNTDAWYREAVRPRPLASWEPPSEVDVVLSIDVQPDGPPHEVTSNGEGPLHACLRGDAALWDFQASAVSEVRLHLRFERN